MSTLWVSSLLLVPSRYETLPRNATCKALPQYNALHNAQGGAMLTSFRSRATERG
ncbi:MAG: hypothetical protein HOI10_00330 [Deltaproteobacteria bacterium]|nr:hypothetical protein [Deltaproteobacteria bacterium]